MHIHQQLCVIWIVELRAPYDGPHVQSPVAFLQALVQHSSHLNSALQHTVRLHSQCTHCNITSFTEDDSTNHSDISERFEIDQINGDLPGLDSVNR